MFSYLFTLVKTTVINTTLNVVQQLAGWCLWLTLLLGGGFAFADLEILASDTSLESS